MNVVAQVIREEWEFMKFLEIESELKAGILSNLQQNELNAIAKKNGFRTMQDMGQEMLLSGDLSFAEYERVLQSN